MREGVVALNSQGAYEREGCLRMTFFFYTSFFHSQALPCSMVVGIDHFLRCDSALPAVALALSLYRLSLRTLEATFATRLLVRPEPLAIVIHLLSFNALSNPL